ncbi:MAG: MBL fold metallo-hydrolase, partial [Bacteroidota bacterium]
EMKKDWGFAAFIEYDGKRILFDTGNNADIFEHNVKAKSIDLTKLDFVVISHRHGDHTGGLNYLMEVNDSVAIYTPKENFGVFGASLPGSFYRSDHSLPSEMRYFSGYAPDTLFFGSPWPKGNFKWVTQKTEIAPGFHLILLKGTWGVDLEAMELSLAIETPEGMVLVVGCSHPTIEKIVEEATKLTNKPIYLVVGGTHLLPASDEEIQRTASVLHDSLQVKWIAPLHCTGEPAFRILRETFGNHYLHSGLGAAIELQSSPKILAIND